MKISQVKEILNSIFEEDDSLKYALATNLAKYGRPQSKASDKPSKLTKGLEKKREKHVKDLKKSMDEKVDLVHVMDKDGKMFGTGERVSTSGDKTLVRFDGSTEKEYPTSQVKNVKEQDMGSPFPGEAPGKGYTTARDIIAMLREKVYPKLNDSELEEFGTTMHDHFKDYMKESISEDKADATRWFSNLKYFYQKAFGELKGEDRETYKQLAKDFFSKLEIDDKVRPVGLNEDEGTLKKIHDAVFKFLKTKKGVGEVKEFSEFPNRYGNNVSTFSIKYNIEDKYNYDLQEIKIDYSTSRVFVPNKGYFPFKTLDDIKNIINKKSSLKESVNEDEGTLNKIADMLDRKFPDLRFNVNTMSDRIDVYGSQQDLFDFGTELHGEKIFDYEVFHIDDDDRGEIVRIVKSDSIMRGGVNEEYKVAGRTVKLNKGKNPNGTDWTVTFLNGKTTSLADVLALIDPKPELTKEEKDKADRCLRIARRKIPQSSAYRSGLIVKCRKGMIWKSEK